MGKFNYLVLLLVCQAQEQGPSAQGTQSLRLSQKLVCRCGFLPHLKAPARLPFTIGTLRRPPVHSHYTMTKLGRGAWNRTKISEFKARCDEPLHYTPTY